MLNMGVYRNSRRYGASQRPQLVFRLTLRGEPLMWERLDGDKCAVQVDVRYGYIVRCTCTLPYSPLMANVKFIGRGVPAVIVCPENAMVSWRNSQVTLKSLGDGAWTGSRIQHGNAIARTIWRGRVDSRFNRGAGDPEPRIKRPHPYLSGGTAGGVLHVYWYGQRCKNAQSLLCMG